MPGRNLRKILTLVGVVLVCGCAGVVADEPGGRTITVEGQVKLRAGEKADGAALKSGSIAVFASDGREIPIADDEGGRMFYLDPAMRGRDVRLKLIERPGGRPAEILQSEVRHEGRWRVPQYYCDVCTIAVRYPQVCLCCQGPMEFRYKPER